MGLDDISRLSGDCQPVSLAYPKPTKKSRKSRRDKTAAEERYIAAAVALGCAVCKAPAQYHHCKGLEFGTGMGLRAKHTCGFGLCDYHHDLLHDILGKDEWEARFGRQYDIWQRVKTEVEASMGGV